MQPFYIKGKKYNCMVGNKPYFRTSVTINGKTHQVYGDGEKDARRKIDEIKATTRAGLDRDAAKTKFGVAFSYWLYEIKRIDQNLKPTSFSRYDSIYRKYLKSSRLRDLCCSQLTPPIIQSFVTELYNKEHTSAVTIKYILLVLGMFFRWGIDAGCFIKDPSRNVVIPGDYSRKKKEVEIFTQEERQKILSYITETNYLYGDLIRLAFATGMRVGEIIALKWEDVSENEIYVHRSSAYVKIIDGKGNQTKRHDEVSPKSVNSIRHIPILPSTYAMLCAIKEKQSARRKPSPYVFTSTEGTQVRYGTLTHSYRRMLKSAGVPYKKFHAIRHTFATEAIRRGVNVKDLQMIMGHSDISMTYVYVQSDEQSKKAAIERMGEIL